MPYDNFKGLLDHEHEFGEIPGLNSELLGKIGIVATLPEAGAEYYDAANSRGLVFLFTGATDANHTKGHFYQCGRTGATYSWQDAQVGTFPVGNCSGIRCITQGNSVRLKWKDPANLTLDNVTLATWAKTVVVRKAGSYPTGPEDGTVVLTSTVRDQYSASAYIDTIPEAATTYYYQFFPYSTDGMLTSSDANRAVTGDLTWASIQDIVRSGEASSYFAPGDTLSVELQNISLSSASEYDLEILGIDQMTPTTSEFARNAVNDSGSAYAWADSAGSVIYTASATPGANDIAYLDFALTVATATVVSLTGSTLRATWTHNLALCFKQTTDSLQFDPAQAQYALTADTVFHPEYSLSVKIGATTYTFDLADRNTTGTSRIWYNRTGAHRLAYSNANSRWEIWSCVSATHVISGTTAADYQSVANAEPTAGTWNSGNSVTTAKDYYTTDGEGNYTEAAVTAGSAVAANTYYELNPHTTRVSYGCNRWRESPLRQYLNATGNDWYTAKSIWSNTPAYSTYKGFLDRLPSDFKATLGKVKLTTARNVVDDCGGSDVTEDLIFLLSMNELGLGKNNAIDEGSTMARYATATNDDRKKYAISGSATYWWMRSPGTGYACVVYYVVGTSGALSDSYAYGGGGVAPACVII